ncbi:MAG: tyrosine-type recombinase/integrase [bacterium]|nr:tyrosine-type recombinase/integrase [bacterium]
MIKLTSRFAPYITQHLAGRKRVRVDDEWHISCLHQLDEFCAKHYTAEAVLTRQLFMDWVKRRPAESIYTQSKRITSFRLLAKFMNTMGIPSFMPDATFRPRIPRYVPYIFSDEEIIRFFFAIDRLEHHRQSRDRHRLLLVLFHMLYGCGLRISEAVGLKARDVDTERGILTLRGSKNDKDRLVPMSVELTEECRLYCEEVLKPVSDDDWFFPNPRRTQAYRSVSIYNLFRKILAAAGIEHRGKGRGPRLHDFRHTFTVHCLRRWIREGKELNVYLPYLTEYLGHATFSCTAYYLRLTPDVHPDIRERVETAFGTMLPEEVFQHEYEH